MKTDNQTQVEDEDRPTIRAVLADDHNLLRASVKRLLESTSEIKVVEEAETGAQAITAVARERPDILILDIQMPEMGGLEVISKIGNALPILVVTALSDAEYARRTLRLGALGFVTKHTDSKELITAVREVAAGNQYISTELLRVMEQTQPRKPYSEDLVSSLSKREFQVMNYLAQGLSNREIADLLEINVKTVDSHRGHLLKKLHLRNNADLTRFAIRHGFVQL